MRVKDAYFDWLIKHIQCDDVPITKYGNLLSYLFDREFTYILPMDKNRFDDGIALRSRFSYKRRLTQSEIDELNDIGPCSVLEMLIALSIRCEENIMFDPSFGDRTGVWFWTFIDNLGLLDTGDDKHFNVNRVSYALDIFLNREYDRDGSGSIVVVEDPSKDLRNAEIWMQLMWYLNEI